MSPITSINQIIKDADYYIDRGEMQAAKISYNMIMHMKLIDVLDLISEGVLLIKYYN